MGISRKTDPLDWQDIDAILRIEAFVHAENKWGPYRSKTYNEEILRRFNEERGEER